VSVNLGEQIMSKDKYPNVLCSTTKNSFSLETVGYFREADNLMLPDRVVDPGRVELTYVYKKKGGFSCEILRAPGLKCSSPSGTISESKNYFLSCLFWRLPVP